MNVLILSSFYKPFIAGGAEVILQEHVKALQAAGVTVSILTIGPGSRLTSEMVDGVRVWRAGMRNLYFHFGTDQRAGWLRMLWHAFDVYNPMMKSYIRKVVEIEKPQVASCHILRGWSISAWDALDSCGVPIVQVLHDQYLLCAKSMMFKNNRLCVGQCGLCRLLRLPHAWKSNRVTAVVGVSQFILDKIVSHGLFRETQIKEIIHNVRNLPYDPGAVASRSRDGNLVFGFIGTVSQHKGIEMLLDTFVRGAPPNWRLRIAGSGSRDYVSALKARFTDERIAFLGHTDPRDFFSTVDVSVVPSLWEDTFPGSVFESLLFGMPVIGSHRGGIPEMIVTGKTGLLFDPDDPDSLLDSMHQVARQFGSFSKSEIISMSSKFKDQHSWNTQWLDLYQKVVSVTKC